MQGTLINRKQDVQVTAAALLKNNCDLDITVLCLIQHADKILQIDCSWVAMS